MEIANTSHDAEIDALRIPWETTDQWNLRREFLKRNWNKMPIERLRGRAQAFINMQFMGCSYVSFDCFHLLMLCQLRRIINARNSSNGSWYYGFIQRRAKEDDKFSI